MSILSVAHLVKSYGGVPAVRDISFEIPEGEICVLLGPSGCGKTTTMRCIAGLEEPNSGEITIAGRLVNGPGVHVAPEKRNLGMVFQSYAIWPHMTVFDNVSYGLVGRPGVAKSEIRGRVLDALTMVQLHAVADRSATQLSGGQQQRVALARALVYDPPVLLLDEPLSNLDAKLREEMRAEIGSLQRRVGVTTVYVTHDQEEAMALADNIVVMNNGVIEQAGSALDLYLHPKTRFVARFFGKSNLLSGTISGPHEIVVNGAPFNFEGSSAELAVGQEAELCLRPEFWTVLDGRPPATQMNVLKGRVTALHFMGSRWQLTLEASGNNIDVEMHVDQPHPVVGDEVYVHCPPHRCIVLAATSPVDA